MYVQFEIFPQAQAMLQYNILTPRQSNSRKVIQRAFAFTIAYLVTFIPFLVGLGYSYGGAGK
jgi:hypothetical protein